MNTPESPWEDVIAGFESYDRAHPPSPGATVLVGSSSIGLWPDPFSDLAPHPVIQRGFGGSRMNEVLQYYSRIVKPYAPSRIVVYAGDNDIAIGRKPTDIAHDLEAIFRCARTDFPAVWTYCISVKPSPARHHLHAELAATNVALRALCASMSKSVYVDVWSPMHDMDGRIRGELYREDGLHMNAHGYSLWANKLKNLFDREAGHIV